MISDEIIEKIKDAADMVDVVGEFVQLKKTGADFRGPCPFHGGQKRNFAVIPRKQLFYCFVCHEAGDVFTFYMRRFGYDYPTAVREVGKRVGISVPERSTAGPDPNEPLYSAVAIAHDWYSRFLREAPEAEDARRYLLGRGFDVVERPDLGFGFSPRGDAFLKAMHEQGIETPTLLEAGLAVEREDGSVRPRFWNRVLVPIYDMRGRVVAFRGRVLGDAEPKYLNSPDSKIFNKGKLLFNLNTAKLEIRKEGFAVLVEGYFDVLALVDVGVGNTVASQGTAFTRDQAQLLKRYTDETIVLYDSDAAGLKATFRAADTLLSVGMRVLVATMPEGEDPDTLARAGRAQVTGILKDAVDVMERKIQILEHKGWLGTLQGRRKALDRLVPTIRAASDPVTHDLYVSRVSECLGTSRESVAREVARMEKKYGQHEHRGPVSKRDDAPPEVPSVEPHLWRHERLLGVVAAHYPRWRKLIRERLPDPGLLLEPGGSVLLDLLDLPETEAPGGLMEKLDEPHRMALEMILAMPPVDEENVGAFVSDTITAISAREARMERARLDRELPFAGNKEEKDRILRESRRIRSGKYNL